MKYILPLLILVSTLAMGQTAKWDKFSGPSVGLHDVYSLLESDGYLFAGSDSGLWRSNDYGIHWEKSKKGIDMYDTVYQVRNIVRSKNGTLYISIYHSKGYKNCAYRSTNKGTTWTPLTRPTQSEVNALAVDSTGILYLGSNSGFYESSDEGKTWKVAASRFDKTKVLHIDVSPSNGTYMMNQSQLWRRPDSDTSWQNVAEHGSHAVAFGYTDTMFFAQDDCILKRKEVSNDPWDTVFCYYSGAYYSSELDVLGQILFSRQFGGLLISRDRGTTWTVCDSAIPYHEINCVSISQNGSVYLGGSFHEIWMSQDTARAWVDLNNSLPYSQILSLSFTSKGTLFAGGTALGRTQLFRSTNSGVTWTGIGYPENSYYEKMSVGLNGVIMAPYSASFGAGDSGYVISRDEGLTWKREFLPISSERVYNITQSRNGTIYAADLLHLYRSDDSGRTWGMIRTFTEYETVVSMAVTTNDDLWIVMKTGGISGTTDHGATWTDHGKTIFNLKQIVIDSAGNIFLSVSGSGGKVLRFTASHTFQTIYNGDAILEAGKNILYASVPGKILWTTDQGKNWTTYINEFKDKMMVDATDMLWGVRSGVYKADKLPLSIRTEFLDNRIDMYPNPSSTNLTVLVPRSQGESVVTIKILDLLGNTILERVGNASDKLLLDVRSFPNGVYQMYFQGDGLNHRSNFVVAH